MLDVADRRDLLRAAEAGMLALAFVVPAIATSALPSAAVVSSRRVIGRIGLHRRHGWRHFGRGLTGIVGCHGASRTSDRMPQHDVKTCDLRMRECQGRSFGGSAPQPAISRFGVRMGCPEVEDLDVGRLRNRMWG